MKIFCLAPIVFINVCRTDLKASSNTLNRHVSIFILRFLARPYAHSGGRNWQTMQRTYKTHSNIQRCTNFFTWVPSIILACMVRYLSNFSPCYVVLISDHFSQGTLRNLTIQVKLLNFYTDPLLYQWPYSRL